MKKSILLFVIAASTIVAGLVSCKEDGCSNPDGFNGTFNGTHRVWIGNADLAALNIIAPISDVVSGSVSGSSLTIGSDLLPLDLHGTISSSNANSAILDTLKLAPLDTITIPSTVAPGGTLKIYDLIAVGTGTLDCKTVNTSLKVLKGKTNLTISFGSFHLDNLDGLGLELKGSFTKP